MIHGNLFLPEEIYKSPALSLNRMSLVNIIIFGIGHCLGHQSTIYTIPIGRKDDRGHRRTF
jgi:hypothetical protein